MKFKARMQWDVDFYHGDDHRLRFREVLSRERVGRWRSVGEKKKEYWEIEPGKTSGLPQNLFVPLYEAIVGSLHKITPESRVLPRFRRHVRTELIRSASKVFRHCAAEEESKTRVKFILHHRPFMHFLIVDFQEHGQAEFFKMKESGDYIKNRYGRPRRDLGRLADVIREDKSSGLRKLEHESKAVLRWAVVFFYHGDIWLVPGKSRKKGDDE